MIAQKQSLKKAAPEVKPNRGDGRQQLLEAFLLLACIVLLVGTGLMIYFDDQIPPEMIHKIEVAK